MSLYRTSIDRPVLATVFAIFICVFGIIAIFNLPVREYPAIDPPIITVATTYTGAAPEVVESQITEPLEENINAVAGIRSMSSTSREGRSTIVVEFGLDTDLETAANDVRERVSRAQRDLPPDADPPVVTKEDADNSPIVMVAIGSKQRDLLELSDIADRRFKPRLQTIDGVSEVGIWGEKRYAMRIYLDRTKLASFNLTPVDVRRALDAENVELPSGRIDGQQVELSVRTLSRLKTPEEFNNLVIKEANGRTVRLRDVGEAAIGNENDRTILKKDGIPAVAVVLRPQPGANQIAMADEFYRRLELIKKDLPPDIETTVGFDTSTYIRASIHEVTETIGLAVVLVVVIIFAFLRSWRTTLIPAVVIPVSLLGGFFLMYLCGFSINVLTLLAMVLSIGLVVDDAIIVLENIYTKIEQGLPVREAGYEGTREIFFAVIATTLALVAVFLPILFLGGVTGKLFREFGVTLGGTVAVSSFVALSLTPMLCTKLLRRTAPSRFYLKTEPFFESGNAWYRASVGWFLRHRWLALVVLIACGSGTWLFLQNLESELAPMEDRGRLRVAATAPEGAAYDYMSDYMDELTALIGREIPESDSLVSVTSPGFGAASSVNSGFVRVALTDKSQRSRSQSEIADALLPAVRDLPASRVVVIQEPTISTGVGGRNALPLQFVLQAPTLANFEEKLPGFLAQAEESPVFSRIDVNLKFNKPEVRVAIDRERAQTLGVSARDIAETLNLGLSEQRFGYYQQEGKQYFVIGQLVREHRDEGLDLRSLEVPSSGGQPIRLDNVVRFSEEISPPQLFRFNRYASATVSASLSPGYTLSQGIEEMERIADATLGEAFQTDLNGEAREFRDSASSLQFVFLLALLLVYLVLAGQFESFRDPFIILLSVPLAVTGALAALYFSGQTLNIFSQIGLIMLIGLVTKNGILIVEFANQRKQESNLSPLEAAMEGAAARFRPVLMTTFSTILGIAPIAFALGAGSESRVSMGIAVIGGMAIGSFFTLFVVPAIYSFVSKPVGPTTKPA